jgi:hypothetical protein
MPKRTRDPCPAVAPSALGSRADAPPPRATRRAAAAAEAAAAAAAAAVAAAVAAAAVPPPPPETTLSHSHMPRLQSLSQRDASCSGATGAQKSASEIENQKPQGWWKKKLKRRYGDDQARLMVRCAWNFCVLL